MGILKCKTKFDVSGDRKNKVFFSCHSDDFSLLFNKICEDVFRTHDCAIYYFEDPNCSVADDELDEILGQMELLIIPVTKKLLFDRGTTLNIHVPYAREKGIPILPIVMENEIDKSFLEEYSKPESFGEKQYISPILSLKTAVTYEDKLRSVLESLLIGEELKDRIRAAFDAYIFLSYRKKDRKYAAELMRLIHGFDEFRDIAIWYDEYLTPGESFRENIDHALQSSNIMALLVTPSILEEPEGKPNFVMGEEYPRAVELGKRILPTEMEPVDHGSLNEKFISIPDCVNPFDRDALKERLIDALYDVAISENNGDPEHNFLIGLAYLDGIDVEADRERGERLIYESALAGVPEAILKFYNLLNNDGSLLFRDQEEIRSEMLSLSKRLHGIYAEKYGEADIRTLDAMKMSAEIYRSPYSLGDLCRLCEETYGKEHPKTIEYYATYLKYLHNKRIIEIGEEMYPICVKVLGEDNNIAFTYLSYMAEAYSELASWDYDPERQNDTFEKWYATLEKAYKCKERFLGRLHPQTLEALKESLISCQNEERGRRIADYYVREAEATGKSALEGARNAVKKWRWNNDASERRETAKEVYKLFRKEKGEEDDETLSILSDHLADAYCDLKDAENELKIREYLCSVYKNKGEKYKKQADISGLLTARIQSELGNYRTAFDILTDTVGEAEYEKTSRLIIEMLKYDSDRADCLRAIGNALIACGSTDEGLIFIDGMLDLLQNNLGAESDAALDALPHLLSSYLLAGEEKRAIGIIEDKIRALCERPRESFIEYSLWGENYDRGYKTFKKAYGIANEILGDTNAVTKLSLDALLYFLEQKCLYHIGTRNDLSYLINYADEFYSLKEVDLPSEHREIIKSMYSAAKKRMNVYNDNMAKSGYRDATCGGMIITDSQNEGLASDLYRHAIDSTNRFISDTDTVYILKDGALYSHFEGKTFFGYCNTTKLVRYSDSNEEEGFTLPEAVDTIENYAFAGADKLVSIRLNRDVRQIGKYAFAGCASLKEIYISKGIESIGESAFYDCPNIERIIFDGSINEWAEVSQITPYGSYRNIPVHCLDKNSFLISK